MTSPFGRRADSDSPISPSAATHHDVAVILVPDHGYTHERIVMIDGSDPYIRLEPEGDPVALDVAPVVGLVDPCGGLGAVGT